MFDLYDNNRLLGWKQVRSEIETASDPFQLVADTWAKAPFVNNYLNPFNPKEWPDPWKLILDGKYDNLGITLGMCYTLQLTDRFKGSRFEIHMLSTKEPRFILVIDGSIVLNLEYKVVNNIEDLNQSSSVIWSS